MAPRGRPRRGLASLSEQPNEKPEEAQLTAVRVPKPLQKKLAKKGQISQGAILGCIRQLRVDWRHPGLRAKKLSGRTFDGNDVFEARASKGDRVTFYWDGERIVLENHCHHDILKRR